MTTYIVPAGMEWGESYQLDCGTEIDIETARRILARAVELFNASVDGITWVPHTSELLYEFDGSEVSDFQRTEYPSNAELVEKRKAAVEMAFQEFQDGELEIPETGDTLQGQILRAWDGEETVKSIAAKLGTNENKVRVIFNRLVKAGRITATGGYLDHYKIFITS